MRLVTFPGQGSAVSASALARWCKSLAGFQHSSVADVVTYVERHPGTPGAIAACSNLLYQGWLDRGLDQSETMMLGHSLGELSALNASGSNALLGVHDVLELAQRRHALMCEATAAYVQAHGGRGFAARVVTLRRAGNLRAQLQLSGTLQLANHNTLRQCIVTGAADDPAWASALPAGARVDELLNPDGIPFHNDAVLRRIQGPLYDALWERLARNGVSRARSLDRPLLSCLDGAATDRLDVAVEKFVRSSTNVVEFVAACRTAVQAGATAALHVGPGRAVGALVDRNTGFRSSETLD
ncbi:AaceriACR108Cp [[Ashbya] aceris (nom. inval.)]|nr:AaceriACR108Cp [[Ashbya] aceris (nom. inval.)]